jgi:hypothetical protein
VYFDEWRRKVKLHIRCWFSDDGTMRPGKGATIAVQDIPWLRAQLEAAEQEALRCGKLEQEDYTEHDLPVPPTLRASA